MDEEVLFVSLSWRGKSKGLCLSSIFNVEVLNVSFDGLPSLFEQNF